MIKYCKTKLLNHITSNKLKYAFCFFCLAVGISVGAINAMNTDNIQGAYLDTFRSSYIIGSISGINVFLKSVLLNLRVFGLLWLSGWFIWLTPLNFLEVGAKGYSLGYAYAFLISGEHLKGLAFSFVTIFFQNLLLLPSIIVYSVSQLNFAIKFDKLYKSDVYYKERKNLIIGNLILFFATFLPIAICGYIEGFIIPFLIKIII